MAITFKMRQREDGYWIPDHPEAADVATYWDNPDETFEQKRAALFGIIDAQMPGVFTLDYDPAELRTERLAAVSERTRDLLRDGFSYGTTGQRFPCDSGWRAYYNLLRLQAQPLFGLTINYPIVVPAVDDRSDLSIGNAATLALFLAAEASHVRAMRDGDAQLKRQLREAQTVVQLNAVVDSR